MAEASERKTNRAPRSPVRVGRPLDDITGTVVRLSSHNGALTLLCSIRLKKRPAFRVRSPEFLSGREVLEALLVIGLSLRAFDLIQRLPRLPHRPIMTNPQIS